MQESEEELKSLLMRMKDESEKTDLRLSIKKLKIMTSGLIISWQTEGEKVETDRSYFLGLKNHWSVTAALKLKDACSLEGKLWQT